MKNLIIMFTVAIALTFSLFVLPHIDTGLIILLTIDIFALFMYAMIKFKQYDMIHCKYEMELRRRQDLENELMKEIDLTNTIITRAKIPSLGNKISNPVSHGR